jgi:Xaa-Pro aminopeptidase
MDTAARMQRVLRLIGAQFDALLVSNPANVRYLLAQPGIGRGAVLLSASSSRSAVDPPSVFPELPLRGYDEREPPDFASIIEVLDGFRGRLGYEDNHLSVRDLRNLQDILAGRAELCPAGEPVEKVREVKDADEIERIEAAAELGDHVLYRLAQSAWRSRTERDIALEIEELIVRVGGDGAAFAPLVARPPRSALPHGTPGTSEIEAGDIVLVDVGVRLDGYLSDCTRMFSVGEVASDALDNYATLLAAQEEGLRAAKPGVDVRAVDKAARARTHRRRAW